MTLVTCKYTELPIRIELAIVFQNPSDATFKLVYANFNNIMLTILALYPTVNFPDTLGSVPILFSNTHLKDVAPSTPFIPDVPLVPEVPDVPLVPSVPEVPDVPVVPLVPEVAEVPDVPLVPSVPEVPDVPVVPLVPEVAEVPDVPEVPLINPAFNQDEKFELYIHKLPSNSST